MSKTRKTTNLCIFNIYINNLLNYWVSFQFIITVIICVKNTFTCIKLYLILYRFCTYGYHETLVPETIQNWFVVMSLLFTMKLLKKNLYLLIIEFLKNQTFNKKTTTIKGSVFILDLCSVLSFQNLIEKCITI